MKASEALQEIKATIAEASQRAGRRADEVELVAVSKTFPPEAVREAAEAPHDLFGESKVQEALAKIPLLPSHLRWHFIGHLQKNKIRKIIPLVEAIHSVDSVELAEDIDRIAAEEGRRLDVYVQVNIGHDAAKFGFDPETVRPALEQMLRLPRVDVVGLMTVPPLAEKPEQNRANFAALRELRDQLEVEFGTALSGLSMGMSEDYAVAIEEGSTIVRVGSAIFGRRSYVL